MLNRRGTLAPPDDPDRRDNLFAIRFDACQATYELLRSRGGEFLTPPVDHGSEIRCFLVSTVSLVLRSSVRSCD